MWKKIIGYFSILLILVLLLEIVFRSYFAFYFKTPFFKPSEIVNHYYPELKKLDKIYDSEKVFNVLILGGSVITYGFSDIQPILQERLSSLTNQTVRIYNLAKPAHASLDSYHKINQREIKGIDLVLFYHGINELRANNCPPELFQTNYEHFSWYKEIALVTNNTSKDYFTTLFGLQWIGIQLSKKITGNVPTHFPKAEWVHYGKDIKTKESFEQNIRRILERAQQYGIPVLLNTFAYHQVDNYSKEAFLNKKLDYGSHLCLTESWGAEANVVHGLVVHNHVIKKIISEGQEGIYFFDMEKHLTKNSTNFNDICHITSKASKEFVDLLLPSIEEIILAKK